MKKIFLILLSVFLLIGGGFFVLKYFKKSAPPVVTADPKTIRTISNGTVIGFIEPNGAHVWRGIPFAKPPVGELRWKAPLPPDDWNETLEALESCIPCTQYGGPLASVPKKQFETVVGSEDCLYLNIWAPPFAPEDLPSGNARLPVMVWIHGGGNSVGHGGSYNGKYLAEKQNVIIVTTNYRLGPFGWFYHPALAESVAPAEGKSGNFGTLDIIRALSWVKRNISAFGGNPDNVTIFGESAGGVNTFSMLLSPKARGLFHKAISQSGMARVTPQDKALNYTDLAPKGHAFSSKEVINQLLIADHTVNTRQEAINYQNKMSKNLISSYLKGKTKEELLSVYQPGPFGMISFPSVIQDGRVIPKGDILEIFSDPERYNAVPVIMGTNRDEFKMFMARNPDFINTYFKIFVRFKDKAYYDLFAKYKSDFWKANGVDEIAAKMAIANGNHVFGYRFDWDEEPKILGMDMSELIGAAHGVEIPFVLNSFDEGSGLLNVFFTEKNYMGRKTLSDSMSSYWAQFAYTGEPGKGRKGMDFYWEPWGSPSEDKARFIIFDTEEDGGIRMSSDTIFFKDIKERLLTDPSFKHQDQLCKLYFSLFHDTHLWREVEFQNLGEQGCEGNY